MMGWRGLTLMMIIIMIIIIIGIKKAAGLVR